MSVNECVYICVSHDAFTTIHTLYFLHGRESLTTQVLNTTSSGGACVNESLMHVICPDLPFGMELFCLCSCCLCLYLSCQLCMGFFFVIALIPTHSFPPFTCSHSHYSLCPPCPPTFCHTHTHTLSLSRRCRSKWHGFVQRSQDFRYVHPRKGNAMSKLWCP
jgi:hypothetical protein